MAADVPAGGYPELNVGMAGPRAHSRLWDLCRLEGPLKVPGTRRGADYVCVGGRGGCLGFGEAGVSGSR